MIYKIILNIYGDKLQPDNFIKDIRGEYLISYKNSPGDKKFNNREEEFEFGSIIFSHPKRFAFVHNSLLAEYKEWFIDFLLVNYELFVKNNVEEFEFCFDMFKEEGEQCNFSIFNRTLLNKINKVDISYNVSVYTLKKEEYQRRLNIIKLDWGIL